MKESVLVLGAGASAADGAPVISTYLKEIERCFGHRSEWYVISKALKVYTTQRGINGRYPPLNEFLTYLDDQVEAGKRVGDQDPRDIRFELLKLAFGRLTEQERPRPRFTWPRHVDVAPCEDTGYSERKSARQDFPKDPQCADIAPYPYDISPDRAVPDYVDIAFGRSYQSCNCMHSHWDSGDPYILDNSVSEVEKSVQPKRANTPANHRLAEVVLTKRIKTVISTNYDLIFDQAAEDTGILLDYGVGKRPVYKNANHVTLLKLHGSVNWLACLECGYIDVWPNSYPTQTLWSSEHIYRSCGQCKSQKWEDTLVTPSRRRPQDPGYLRQLWDMVKDALSCASCVIFIGYSLPDEDTDIINLLGRGISDSARILVIDPNMETIRRYRRLFGSDRVSEISRSLTTHLWDTPDVRELIAGL